MDFTRTEEIIKSIFSKTTIKRGYLADSFDTAAMRTNYSKYKNAMSESDKVEYHKLLLTDFANTDLALSTMVEARIECLKESSKVYDYIDEEQVAVILQNIRTRITSQYVEKNPYYRIVCGLPDLQDVTPIYVDSKYSNICDTTKAIHTMTDSELSALYINGVLTELAEKYPLLMYIPYLHRRVDIITARDASDFDIIKQGTVEEESHITDLFFNTYNKNKNIFLHRHANTFYQRTTEYYESLMSMMLVWATRIDVIREIHANIDIDYYDDYDLATIFQDYSLKIDEGISKDIRADIAKNINLLVRNRGTNAVLENLADIFNIKNIYNYIIQKLYVNGEPTLRCHAVPVSDMQNMSKYLTREYGYITYGKLVENDKTWADKPISTKTTAEINVAEADEYISTYEKLLNTDFSYIHSKYVSVDNIINMSQMSLDFSLFFNYMLATTNVHQVTVNHRLSNAVMTLPQVYAYLCSLLSTKYKFKDNIVANGSELQYVLGLHDDYLDTDTEYHKYDTIMLHIPIYEDQEITVYEDKEFEELIDVPTYIDEEVIIMVPTLTKVIRNVPVQKIIQVQVGENIVPETAVHTYTLTEVQITDILRLFEGHFSGTDYMYILQNWITLNPNASFSDFIDTFCSDRQMIYTMKTIIRETYDIGQYHIAQTVLHYMTRMKAKTSVYGNVTTYSAYLKDTVPNLYAYYNDKMINTTDDNWSQIFSDEIVYTLNLISKLIEELDNDLYTNTFSFLEDVRDTQINELKNVLSYLVSYFTSMTMTIKDPEFKYELGDEEDSLLVKEGISSTRSNRYLNKFDGIDETLSMRRKKSISESFEIRDYVAIKYSKFKEKIIGG